MRAFVAGCLFCVLPATVLAFDGNEHCQLSNTALAAAEKLVTPDARLLAELGPDVNFGNITEIVDWFRDPEHEFLQASNPDELKSIRDHRRYHIRRLIAVHFDEAHFQLDALYGWRKYHQHAIDLAREHSPHALWWEAVALHYLQDFFSVGHAVTPRDGLHDAVAGALHDKFNADGVDFSVDGQPASRFHGDGALNCPANADQKEFLERVSTISVAQVLSASLDKPLAGLEPCFARRTTSGKGMARGFYGSDGGIRMAKNASFQVAEPSDCNVANDWFGRYQTLEDNRLKQQSYDFSGWIARLELGRATYSQGLRSSLDVINLFDADDPPRSEVCDRETGECINCGLGSWIAMGGFGASYTRGTGYHAIGFPIETYFGVPWSRTLLYALRVKPTRYTYLDTQHWKWDVGLHATLGVDVFATGVTVERSRHIDAQGRFRPTYFVMVGLEGVVASTWKKYIHPVCPCANPH